MKKNIVILGAGFGGITAVLKLAKKIGRLSEEYKIILIDKYHHQLYTPALYEIAAIPMEYADDIPLKSSVLIPVADAVKRKPITFICDEVSGLKEQEKKVILKKGGDLSFEYLVFALGAETNYFNIPGLREHSYPLKTFDDGARLRSKIEELVQKKDEIKITVGGSGASGVELVAEFINFVCAIKEKIDNGKNVCNAHFLLVEASLEILPGFDAIIVEKTKKRLENLGVRIKTNTTIAEVNADHFICKDGKKENFDLLIWTGGVKGPEIFGNFGLPLSQKGSTIINEYLQIQEQNGPKSPVAIGQGHIFAIGDNSSMINPKTGKPLIWNVPVAEAEGRIAAKNILRSITGKPLKKFTPAKKYPFILTIGKKYAIADFVYFKFCGFTGWFAKQLVELRYLLFILPPQKAIRTWLLAIRYYTSND